MNKDVAGIISWIMHILRLKIYKEERPIDSIGLFTEHIIGICALTSVLSLINITFPYYVSAIIKTISIVLFFTSM